MEKKWTFLTNHSQVFLRIMQDPMATTRMISEDVGLTERSVQTIVKDLANAGYISVTKRGRRNSYELCGTLPMPHPEQQGQPLSELLEAIAAY